MNSTSTANFTHKDVAAMSYKESRAYFAHPITEFGTRKEKMILEKMELLFGEIVNPNTDEHKLKYDLKGMSYYLKEVLPNCDVIVFMAMPNGKISSGVAKEIKHFVKQGKTIFEAVPYYRFGYIMHWCGEVDEDRFLDFHETTRYLKAIARKSRR